MWLGKWDKELEQYYDIYADLFDTEPDCDTDADLDSVSYNDFKRAIVKSITLQQRIQL